MKSGTWDCVKINDKWQFSARRGHTANLYKDQIIVFGGTNEKGHRNDLMCLDIKNNNIDYDQEQNFSSISWIPLETNGRKPGPRRGHYAEIVDDKLLICGGENLGTCFFCQLLLLFLCMFFFSFFKKNI